MPVIVDADSARASSLASSVGHGSHVVSTLDQLDGWLARRPNEYAVLVGPEVDIEAAMAVADRLRLKRPGLGVLVLRHQVGTDLLTSAIRAGVREVLTIGDHESLRIAVERTRETFNAIHGPTASDVNDGRVITVFSPKGGVGKTTVAVNLALALSDNGANRVCLVDLDLAFGDVAITLQLIPEHTISEAVEVEDHLDMSMLSDLLTRHDSGLHVLAAPTHPDAKDRISTKLVRRVLAALRTNFDYIVVDTSPGFDEQVLSAFDETDECIVVATLDVPTVKNVKMSMETLDLLNLAHGPPLPGAEPRGRGGRAHARQRRDDPEDGRHRAVPELDGCRQLDEPRPADRALQAGPPRQPGDPRARPPALHEGQRDGTRRGVGREEARPVRPPTPGDRMNTPTRHSLRSRRVGDPA